VVETGSAREVHHFGVLAGYGAEAVHPYLAMETLAAMHADLPGDSFFKFDPTDWKVISQENYRKDPQLERPYDFDYLVLERK